MGAIISALAEVVELATLAGVSAEAVLTGEAVSLIEAEVAALGVTEGLTSSEAVALLGVTGENS